MAVRGAHKTRTRASRIRARAVWFSSDCYTSCHQFCMSFDTTDQGKLQELTKIQKKAWIILEMKRRLYNLFYRVRPKKWNRVRVRGSAAQVDDTVSWFCLGHGPGEWTTASLNNQHQMFRVLSWFSLCAFSFRLLLMPVAFDVAPFIRARKYVVNNYICP